MDFSELSNKYGNFVAPNFQIIVGGTDIVRELFLSVPSCEIDLQHNAASRFSFKIINAFNWEKRTFIAGERDKSLDILTKFGFGEPIEIRFGYGEVAKLVTIIKGIITEVGTSFSEGNTPELEVSGYDPLYLISNTRTRFAAEDALDSDPVSQLISPTGLSSEIENTTSVKQRLEQGEQESDLAFLKKLAERNGYIFYTNINTLYFGKRRNNETAVASLFYGRGLLSFTPKANLAKQVEIVEVRGSSVTGEVFVGTASRDEQSGRDANRKSGAELVAEGLNNQSILRVQAAVRNEAEAISRAQAILELSSNDFFKAEASSIGLPEIRPDVNVEFSGLTATFDKTYWVSGAKHSIDGSSYNTSFELQENTL